MATTRQLVRRRKSVKNTRKITKTMEMVSTAKLVKAQNAAISARPYAKKLQEVIGDLAGASDGASHPLLKQRAQAKKAVVVVMTSDRGLCGGFNANTLKKEREISAELKKRGVEIEYVLHGKKGVGAFRFLKIEAAKVYVGVSDKPNYARAEEIAHGLIERYIAGHIDEAYLVFSRFKSMVNQIATVEKILPLSSLGGEQKEKEGQPEVAKADLSKEAEKSRKADGTGYLFHPEPGRILRELLPLVVKMSVFTAMLDNTAGEHAARRLAMKNATDAADDMIKDLTRKYNRARQGKITQEISEIVGGAAALE